MKLAIIIGTRPDIIKLSCIINKSRKYFEVVLIHTGQNYTQSLNEVFFKEMNISPPDIVLNVVGNNLGETIGNVIAKSYEALIQIKPDCVLILGDTNSALSTISAKRLKIPIFHMEAGNRCFDQNLPEEINRKIIDCISDINLPYTEHARRNLLNEGINRQYIFVTGSPMREVINTYHTNIISNDILQKLNLKKENYFVLSLHREENVDNIVKLKYILDTIMKVGEIYKMPIIYSLHPRSKKRIEENKIIINTQYIKFCEPFGFFDYCNLQMNSKCVLSDSGTLAEESAILKFKAVSVRDSTERPEAIDKGNIILSSINENRILEAIKMAINMPIMTLEPYDYQDEISDKIIKIIQSYTEIINKNIWNKN